MYSWTSPDTDSTGNVIPGASGVITDNNKKAAAFGDMFSQGDNDYNTSESDFDRKFYGPLLPKEKPEVVKQKKGVKNAKIEKVVEKVPPQLTPITDDWTPTAMQRRIFGPLSISGTAGDIFYDKLEAKTVEESAILANMQIALDVYSSKDTFEQMDLVQWLKGHLADSYAKFQKLRKQWEKQ